jgi:hypothetical protein
MLKEGSSFTTGPIRQLVSPGVLTASTSWNKKGRCTEKFSIFYVLLHKWTK